MIGFTLQWDPYVDGLSARKRADTGLLDGQVCAAMIEYAQQLVDSVQWDVSTSYVGWGLFSIQMTLADVLDDLREADHARV